MVFATAHARLGITSRGYDRRSNTCGVTGCHGYGAAGFSCSVEVLTSAYRASPLKVQIRRREERDVCCVEKTGMVHCNDVIERQWDDPVLRQADVVARVDAWNR